MLEWWESLNLIERVFTYIAVPTTLIMIIQFILTIIGIDGGDGDADIDVDNEAGVDMPDGDFELDSGLRIFSFKGIIAFFALFGWVGLCVSRNGGGTALSLVAGFAAGVAGMLLVAWLIKLLLKLQEDGTIDYKNSIGLSGSVYITIPPARTEKGKVNLILQGTYIELDAVTDEEVPITFGQEVVVIGISGNNTLVVRKK